MRDGHWRRLTVTHGHSNRFGPAPTPLEEPVHTNRGDGSRVGSAPAGHGRPIRFLVAEDRSDGGVHDRTGPERRRRRAPVARPHQGPRASGRQRTATVTRGLPSWLVNCLAGLSLQAVGTIDSLPYNPVDHARMRSPLPARAAVGRQQRAIWAQAWPVSSWRLPPVLLGRLSAGQPKPINQASSAGPSRAGIISASYRSG